MNPDNLKSNFDNIITLAMDDEQGTLDEAEDRFVNDLADYEDYYPLTDKQVEWLKRIEEKLAAA